jgi:hypothetical protein
MNIIPLDEPQQIGQLIRHHVVDIDGEVYRRGDVWVVPNRKGTPHLVKFDYYSASNSAAVVWLGRKISPPINRGVAGRTSYPAGQNTLDHQLLRIDWDGARLTKLQIEELQLREDIEMLQRYGDFADKWLERLDAVIAEGDDIERQEVCVRYRKKVDAYLDQLDNMAEAGQP